MRKSRPKTITLLIVVFVWSALRGIQSIVTGSGSADRILLDQLGFGWVAPISVFVILGLDLAAVWYLFKPQRPGFAMALSSIALSAVVTSIAFIAGRAHPDAMREAIIVSRESRGLAVREGALEMALDPTLSLLLLVGSLAVSAFLVLLVIRNRGYFNPSPPSNMPLQPTSGAQA